ncbi:outer membrane beta-barrel protein [Sphingomonas jatrophae]|uniref:Beta-barrel porin 2 n=1 Tax=Sphingomonas jatrophae TaxID=1166337 RepID=A0A1I6M5J5_9SPHN|nr:outer membrane beta-barrel protein [Sphingomonas jatrophae]SFS10959.1 hypothetical protein SAMN05192580_3497 [Sphingomonas jatrophae]
MTWRRTALALPVSLLASPALAQVGEGLIVNPDVPQDFDRGRNVSVQEQFRPDYAPLGVRLGGMTFFPRLEAGGGGTTNAYLGSDEKTAAAFAYVRPSARLTSGWSRHFLQLSGTATLRNYLGESRRNERLWNADARGRVDVSRTFEIDLNANASRNFENVFSGEVASSVAALSRYRRDFASAQATYTNGRIRTFLLADYADFRFQPLPLADGSVRDQSDRNRSVARLTGQIEYARTPSIALFAQLSGSSTDFTDSASTTGPLQDSKAARLLGGVNVDIAGRIRGTISVGYSIRDYKSGTFSTVRGVSIDTRVEAFPTPRLTIGATGQRTIEDSTLNNRAPFWNTRFSVRADYELLRNLIVNATADFSRQRYIDTPLRGNINRASTGARYLASRRVSLEGSVSYSRRSTNDAFTLGAVSEGRLDLGLAYHL